ATTSFLILSYEACGMLLFLTRSSFPRYGRLSMLFLEQASPIPARPFSSSAEALLMSSGAFFSLAAGLAGSLAAGVAGFDVCASTAGSPTMPAENKKAMASATSRVMWAPPRGSVWPGGVRWPRHGITPQPCAGRQAHEVDGSGPAPARV